MSLCLAFIFMEILVDCCSVEKRAGSMFTASCHSFFPFASECDDRLPGNNFSSLISRISRQGGRETKIDAFSSYARRDVGASVGWLCVWCEEGWRQWSWWWCARFSVCFMIPLRIKSYSPAHLSFLCRRKSNKTAGAHDPPSFPFVLRKPKKTNANIRDSKALLIQSNSFSMWTV